ncbi:lysine N(6)-hydroxylase/L-ornithine N(5)-oxygenase family protein [Pseudalkalibacillus salsuginis]|uniref:lysine N(6)-hydroxylase/L-ornithine N(5)-oxygenase family protein n=1 Tax=Pseudalkalibacillus salsuginis TaxID=2910972 RepID=UPI001F2E1D74|nr:SidA/IucD/PvdA family monooxygenase [Pseudalkalibacillus salsuginis]MCF6408986.1 SidA/IucD/PvdA family monooxygenase [Pseudalkalibacillus salsuginis]
MDDHVYDLLGAGIGPFNLSLAALIEDRTEIDALFFDQKPQFDWHPGMLIVGTRLQVPFMADLVTLADPTSRYSFLNYLSKENRLYPFYFLQRLDIPRREYNDYCQWVANELESCRFGKRVVELDFNEAEELYLVTVLDIHTEETSVYKSKNLVLGTGGVPAIPKTFRGFPGEDVFHTAEYLSRQDRCREANSITVIGSGQSAAEVFRELLKDHMEHEYRLNWITRSQSFLTMEESKLSVEQFSPDYVNYFYDFPQEKKDEIFGTQDLLYKGISSHTVTDIYNLLYENTVSRRKMQVGLQAMTEVKGIQEKDGKYELQCHQWQQGKDFKLESEVVIIGTGYRPYVPDFINGLKPYISWDDYGRYEVESDYRLRLNIPNQIYVHSGISHSHGVGSTNLGLAVHRNKVIINHLTGKEIFPMYEKHVFQNFDVDKFEK